MPSMTKEERAKSYCKKLCNNPTPKTVSEISQSINGLVYSDSKIPVSEKYKLEIIELMEQNWYQYYPILEHAENQSILNLISQIKAIIKSNEGGK